MRVWIAVLCLVASVSRGDSNQLAMVFGSSVAQGLNAGGGLTNGSYLNGYAGRLTLALGAQGWAVTNTSIPGNATADALARFDTDVVPSSPRVVLIGLSLANEGLATSADPAGTCERFRTNLLAIVQKCRDHGLTPVTGLVYANNDYTATHYGYVKQMNLTLNAWNLPSVNFLGALEDGTGHWSSGYAFDALHPNAVGYQELYYAIVPSLFSAVAAGLTNPPSLGSLTGAVRVASTSSSAPLVYAPSNRVHSFTVAFRVRTTATGTVAVVRPSYNGTTCLVDFGPGTGAGALTSGSDARGRSWNNLTDPSTGGVLSGLVTTENENTGVGLSVTTAFSGANGLGAGGLTNANPAWLGDLAVNTATEDYFYDTDGAALKLTGLNPASVYSLRLFGSCANTATASTAYVVSGGNGSFTNTLLTSGAGVGNGGGFNGNDAAVATFTGVTASVAGEISIGVSVAQGSTGYLNLMAVTELPAVPSNSVGSIEIRSNAVAYIAPGGAVVTASMAAASGHWVEVAVAHRYASQSTLFFVDGVQAGSVAERLIMDHVVLGGADGATGRPGLSTNADYQAWCVYRAAWNAGEALAQHEGSFQQASLELCAPLQESSLAAGTALVNRAQSLSLAFAGGSNLVPVVAGLAPTGLTAQAGASTIALAWVPLSPTATGSQVDRRRTSQGEFWTTLTNLGAAASVYVDPQPTPGVSYEYRVCSKEGSVYGQYSATANAKIALTNTPGLSLNAASAVASSVEGAYSAANAFDGNSATRWGSAWADNQWIYIDLGTDTVIKTATLDWESASSRDYSLRVRTSAQGVDSPVTPTNWTQIASVSGRSGVDGTGGVPDDLFTFTNATYTAYSGSSSNATVSGNVTGRYFMIYGTTRATTYGHSLWEVTLSGQPVAGGGQGGGGAGASSGFPQEGMLLVDFGPTNAADGAVVANPDMNGNYWNSWRVRSFNSGVGVANGSTVSNLVTSDNVTTPAAIQVTTAGWAANGMANGGLTNPSPALLGMLAVTNATEDYFYTTQVDPLYDAFKITGLPTNGTFSISLFATRLQNGGSGDVRRSRYTVIGGAGTNTVDLQTTGYQIGTGGYNGNNSNIVTVANIIPKANQEVEVRVGSTAGGFGYVGILKLSWHIPSNPGTLLIFH